jgi:cell division protein FtsL
MSRAGSLFWLALALSTGFAMFMVKYAVQNLDDNLARIRKQTVSEQVEIRVLNAEWSYLTQPERLAELNRQFLALAPITTQQLEQSIAAIPYRAPATPTPAETVADAAPADQGSAGGELPPTAASLDAAPAPRATRQLDQLFAQIAEQP